MAAAHNPVEGKKYCLSKKSASNYRTSSSITVNNNEIVGIEKIENITGHDLYRAAGQGRGHKKEGCDTASVRQPGFPISRRNNTHG